MRSLSTGLTHSNPAAVVSVRRVAPSVAEILKPGSYVSLRGVHVAPYRDSAYLRLYTGTAESIVPLRRDDVRAARLQQQLATRQPPAPVVSAALGTYAGQRLLTRVLHPRVPFTSIADILAASVDVAKYRVRACIVRILPLEAREMSCFVCDTCQTSYVVDCARGRAGDR